MKISVHFEGFSCVIAMTTKKRYRSLILNTNITTRGGNWFFLKYKNPLCDHAFSGKYAFYRILNIGIVLKDNME